MTPTPTILSRLRQDESGRDWIDHLGSIDSNEIPEIQLPEPKEIVDALIDLAVPHEDIGPIVALTLNFERDPDAWWVLERAVASINALMGSLDNPPPAPVLPHDDAFCRYFFVYVFLALKPLVEQWHDEQRIPSDISRRSLADLGRNMAVHRKRHGIGGLSLQNWLQLHFRGANYQLGRLQVQRATLGKTTGNAVRNAGHPFGPGDLVLNVHIPDYYGPFHPELCDDSFDRARQFFPRCFPDEPYRVAMCHSWLLDPQLSDYLPETSNIVQFQRRFTLVDRDREPNDDVTFEFVFGRKASEIDTLPRNTTIQRALIDHVRSGKHWYGGSGWLLL